MKEYLLFFIKCVRSKFNFFKLPPQKRALYLEKYQLFLEAGILHMKTKNYSRAAICFEKCSAHRHCMKAFEKEGSYSNAIEVADKYGYYEEGASLCEKIGNMKKAAYFYEYFKPIYAARLYKNQNLFFEVGNCYMKAHDFFTALEYFYLCEDLSKKTLGLKRIEDVAIASFFTKDYDQAFKLFLKLKDYYSALDCAKKLDSPELIQSMYTLLATYEASMGNFKAAAKYIESYDLEKALLYCYLGENNKEAVRLLIASKQYDKAINICHNNHYTELADEILKLSA